MGEAEVNTEIETIERLAAEKADRELECALAGIDLDAEEEIRGLYNAMFVKTSSTDIVDATNDVLNVLLLVAAFVLSVIAIVTRAPITSWITISCLLHLSPHIPQIKIENIVCAGGGRLLCSLSSLILYVPRPHIGSYFFALCEHHSVRREWTSRSLGCN